MPAFRPVDFYGDESSDRSIMSLIMQSGQRAGEHARRSGDIWGSAIGNIGQTLTAGLGAYMQDQQQRQQTERMARRDAAWVSFVEGGEWQSDPRAALSGSLRIWGPEQGVKMAEGLNAFRELGKKGDEAEVKRLATVLQASESFSDPIMERWYPQMRQQAAPVLQQLGIDPSALPETWTPELRQEMRGLGMALRGERPNAGEGFTLSPGQQRFGPDGRPIAQAPPAPQEGPRPVVVGRDLVDPATGRVIHRAPAAERSDNEPLMAVIGPDGNPVYVPRSQAVGARPASTREQGRSVTSGDAGRIADLHTSLDDVAVLRGTLAGNEATGTSARIGAAVPNAITEATGFGAEAKEKQAVIDRVKQVIGKALEGGVLRKEDEAKYEKILPTIGDPPSVVQAKLDGLESALRLRSQTFLESLSDAGYDTSRYQGRNRTSPPPAPAAGTPAAPPPPPAVRPPIRVTSPEQAHSLPPGTEFMTPDGRVMRVPAR